MPSWKKEIDSALKSDGGILTQWAAVQDVLTKHQLLYKARVRPDAFLVHPLNRSGLGINVYGMHKKGARILQVGVDPDLLSRSVAWELSPDPDTRAKQVAFTRNLAASCDGLMAEPSGAERYLSAASSHTTQFFKALCAGCRTPEAMLANEAGKLSAAHWRAADPKLDQLLSEGWEWTVICADVESAYPNLPTLCQRALNSVNATFAGESELEAALAVAAQAERALATGSTEVCFESIGKAVTAETPLESLGAVLGTFVQHYGGGAGAPFLKFLDVIAKEYDDSVSLGTEYWQSVTSLRPASSATSLPLLRVALLASNLCCPKQHVHDGVARLYSKKDVSRLQSAKLMSKLPQAEKVLASCWTKALAAALPHARACRLFGRACSRCISFLLQKRNQEALAESLEAVEASFDADLEARKAKEPPSAASSSSANPSAQPASGFVTLDEASDSLFLAQQKLDLTPGRMFLHKDYPDRVWELQYLEDDKASMLYTNALGTERSRVEVSLSDVCKVLKPSKSPKPRLLTSEEYEDRRDWKTCAVASMQGQIWVKLLEIQYAQEPSAEELLVEYPSKRIYAGKDFKKGELLLVPSTDAATKVSTKCPKEGVITSEVHQGGCCFWVLQPKGLREEDDESFQGSTSLYWFLTKGSPEGQMAYEAIEDPDNDLVYTALVNKRAVKKHEMLELFEKPKPAAQAGGSNKRKR